MGEGESELGLEELLDVRSSDVLLLLNLSNSEDVDRSESSSVSSGHVLVKGLDAVGSGKISVLLVHA